MSKPTGNNCISAGGPTLGPRRKVPTIIEEPDEHLELLPGSLQNGSHLSVPLPKRIEPRDEGDGPMTPRRFSDPEPSGLNNSPSKRTVAGACSFERIMASLLAKAKIVVYLMDLNAVSVLPACGYDCKCPELIDQVVKDRNLNSFQAYQALAVWFAASADELQVQLKAKHNPFDIQKYWTYFMNRYTDCVFDEEFTPIVYIRRSIWLTVDNERQLTDHRLLQLLFEEAKVRVLKKKYTFSNDDIISLGTLLIYLNHGRYSANPQHMELVRSTLGQFFPDGFIPLQRFSIFQGKQRENLVNQILSAYETLSARTNDEIRLRYLTICRSSPLYGAAFFPAFVDAAPKSAITGMLRGGHDFKVSVAVNERGMFLIRKITKIGENPEIVLALSYPEFTFSTYEPQEEAAVSGSEIACLLLLIDVPFQDEAGNLFGRDKRLLPVYSRQAVLIEACLSAFLHRNSKDADIVPPDIIIERVRDVDEQVMDGVIVIEESVVTTPFFVPDLSNAAVKSVPSSSFPGIINHFDKLFLRSADQ